MSTSIGVIGSDLKFASEYILNEASLKSAGVTESDAFMLGQAQSSQEVVLIAATDITVGAASKIIVEIFHSDTKDGSFTLAEKISEFTDTTWGIGAEMLRYVPNSNIKLFCKIKITTNGDQSADKVTCYPVYIAR